MTGERILIVDDDKSIRELLLSFFEGRYDAVAVGDGPEAVRAAKESAFHLYLIDLQLPGMDGLELFQEIRKINSEAVIIILSGHGTIELSVKAMKMGAFDFISKPFRLDLVLALVKNGIEHDRLKVENRLLQKTAQGRYRLENVVVQSPAMRQVYELVEKVADSDSTVLIHGESGTGKELVARAVHYNSPRRNRPIVPVNCGAIPESLLESELFGHEKGAFTGATSSRLGRFELAQGSTLFLDEIGEMPLALQVKLLRVIQEREFERVGGNKSIQTDVRIIAATNQDLESAVAEKRFRKDLFYRLNVIPIFIPPLRERREDIPILIHHFLQKFGRKKNRKTPGVSPEALQALIRYPWPGNVRELENLMERLMIFHGEGVIRLEDLPPKYLQTPVRDAGGLFVSPADFPESGINFGELVSRFEDHLLQQALLKANGVKNRAALLLGLNRTTLVEKLKKRRNMIQ